MTRWGLFPFVRPALAVMLGIYFYDAFWQATPGVILPLALACAVAAVGWLATLQRPLTNPFSRTLSGGGVLLTFVIFGALWTAIRDESRAADHLLHFPPGGQAWQGVVVDGTTRKPTYTSTTVEVWRVRRADGQWQSATGRLKLLIRRDPRPVTLPYGTVVVVNGAFRRVAPAANPEQFDYADYLRHRYTWHEHFAGSEGFAIVGHVDRYSLKAWSLACAEQLAQVIRRYVPAPREGGLLTALVLGLTDDLAADLKTTYGATGTAHVLAVSGLHIALVFGLVIWILGGRKWAQRRPVPRWLTLVVVLLICWSYAFVTGLSASVLRAVVMASLVAVGQAANKRISLFNTLAIAALVLLVYDPQTLFDVGFQLSFAAVFSIALLQPFIAQWWQPEAFVPRQLWAGVTVALAAQIGTAPFTIAYFHQFPTQFIIANLLAVPWSNSLLYGCFLLLLLAGLKWALVTVGIPAEWLEVVLVRLGQLLTKGTLGLNTTMEAIGQLPGAVISGISITSGQMWLLYGILAAAYCWLQTRRRAWLVATVAVVALYIGTRIATLVRTTHERLLVVYSVRHHPAVGLLDGLRATVLADSTVWADSAAGANGVRANVLPHLWARGTTAMRWTPSLAAGEPLASLPPGVIGRVLPDSNRLVQWSGQLFLLLDRPLGVRPVAGAPPLTVDYVLVRGRPRLVPSALARAVACRWVVLDGSGPAGWARNRTQELRTAGFRCHDVGAEGAFIRRVE